MFLVLAFVTEILTILV